MAPVLFFFIMYLSRYMMQGRTLYADTTVRQTGRISQAISWPFRTLGSLLISSFWFLNDTLERLLDPWPCL